MSESTTTIMKLVTGILEERDEAQRTGLCVECGQPAAGRCYSEAGRREFKLSGMCEVCFDAAFAEDDEEDDES